MFRNTISRKILRIFGLRTASYCILAFGFLLSMAELASAEATDGVTPLGTLKTKQHYIEVSAGKDSVVYTVKSLEGKVLQANLNEKTLISLYPQLEHIIYGQADDASLTPTQNKRADLLE